MFLSNDVYLYADIYCVTIVVKVAVLHVIQVQLKCDCSNVFLNIGGTTNSVDVKSVE